MNHLDFLPHWYHADRQRKRRQHRHYVLFGLIAALLAGWSFMLGRSVADLKAESHQAEATIEQSRETMQQALEMEHRIEQLSQQAEMIETLTPRTALSAILAELSHCLSEQIILSRVSLVQEAIQQSGTASSTPPSGIRRIGATRTEGPSPLPHDLHHTLIKITGIAGGGGNVAGLIDRLETSDYFDTVSPGFSRAKKIGDKTVTEFEIVCTVADYDLLR